jgi:tol-pal system protein YbgF
MNRLSVLSLALAAMTLAACATPGQIEIIEREQKTLRSQTSTSRGELDNIRANLADTRANLDQLHRDVNALRERVDEVRYQLDRQIGKSTKEGDQRVKDLEAKVASVNEELKRQAALLKARDDELRTLKEALQAKLTEASSGEKTPGDSDAGKKDYDEAWRLVERKDYRAAIPRFKEFLKKYPNSDFADNAQYWVGECYYAVKDFEQAILEFDAVRRKYPKGDKVPAALLKQGFAFAELGDRVDARLILQELVDRYPQSEEAGKAKQKLKTLGS